VNLNHHDLIEAVKQNWNNKRQISEHVSYWPWDDLPPSAQAEAIKDYIARQLYLETQKEA
jgi:hypothetical protein